MRSCWKLPLCLTEPMPASSRMDPLLAKAEPISNSGSASGRTDLRGKPLCNKLQPEKGVRICERNNSADPQVSEEGGEEVLQAWEQRFPCSPWGRPW